MKNLKIASEKEVADCGHDPSIKYSAGPLAAATVAPAAWSIGGRLKTQNEPTNVTVTSWNLENAPARCCATRKTQLAANYSPAGRTVFVSRFWWRRPLSIIYSSGRASVFHLYQIDSNVTDDVRHRVVSILEGPLLFFFGWLVGWPRTASSL